MKTTIDIPDEVLNEAMRHAKTSTKRDAVLAALTDYNQRHRQARLIKYFGTCKNFITPEELQEMRSSRMKRHGVG